MPYTNIPESKLTPAIGFVVGRLKAELLTRAQTQVDRIIEELKSELICSNQDKLKAITSGVNNLRRSINNINSRIQKITSLVNKLSAIITTINILVEFLKVLPLPTSLPGVTAGTIITFGDKLKTIREFIKQIEDDVNSIRGLLLGASGILILINSLLARLEAIDQALLSCQEQGEVDISKLDERSIKTLDQPSNQQIFSHINKNTGVEYTLQVIEEKESQFLRRYVIAREKLTNRIVIEGEKSFSSSVDILIEEVKFRIDTELT